VSWIWLITKIHLYAIWKEYSDKFWNWLVKSLHRYAVKQDLHLKSKPGQDCDFAAYPVQDFDKVNYKTLTDLERELVNSMKSKVVREKKLKAIKKNEEDQKEVVGEGEHIAKKEPRSSTERAATNTDVEREAGLEKQTFRMSTTT
jgi:hypothetical protein